MILLLFPHILLPLRAEIIRNFALHAFFLALTVLTFLMCCCSLPLTWQISNFDENSRLRSYCGFENFLKLFLPAFPFICRNCSFSSFCFISFLVSDAALLSCPTSWGDLIILILRRAATVHPWDKLSVVHWTTNASHCAYSTSGALAWKRTRAARVAGDNSTTESLI